MRSIGKIRYYYLAYYWKYETDILKNGNCSVQKYNEARLIDMEIKRKIYKKIVKWKKQANGSKALLIEGARRIGKSTVAEEIGKNEYRSYILIDFNKASKKVRDSFDDLNKLDIFFQTLSL